MSSKVNRPQHPSGIDHGLPIKAAIAPYLFWVKVGVLIALAAVLFWAGWAVNGWRWEAKESAQVKALQDQVERDRADYLLKLAKCRLSHR